MLRRLTMAEAALAAACYIYVLHSLAKPTTGGSLQPKSYDYLGLMDDVVTALGQHVAFRKYDPAVLANGSLYVLPKPDAVGGKPEPKTDCLFVEGDPARLIVDINNAKCILLDIRESVPAAARHAAPAASVTSSGRTPLSPEQEAEVSLFNRMNPFAHEHHSDSISLHSTPGSQRFPGSDRERKVFKKQVAKFYGLKSWFPGFMVDMFGMPRFPDNVTLAHIWPSSYTNWQDPINELALPGEFYKNPRNFLLLPRNVHEAFDKGHVIFVPATGHITCFVLPAAVVSSAFRRHYHGKRLVLPRHDAGGVPYKRELAYFALLAKGRVPAGVEIEDALEASMSASADDAGNMALQDVKQRLQAIRRI